MPNIPNTRRPVIGGPCHQLPHILVDVLSASIALVLFLQLSSLGFPGYGS